MAFMPPLPDNLLLRLITSYQQNSIQDAGINIEFYSISGLGIMNLRAEDISFPVLNHISRK